MDIQTEQAPFDLKSAARVFSRIGLALLFYLLFANGLALLLQYGYILLFPEKELSLSAAAWISMLSLSLLGPAVFRLCLGGIEASRPFRGTARTSTMLVLTAIAFAFVYFGNIIGTLASSLLTSLLHLPIPETTLEFVSLLPWYVALPVVVLVGPLAEEYIFRKCILDRTRVYGEKLSILFSAILFAFYHSSVQQFFYALLIGLLLGYLYLRTGSLLRCWLIHAAINLLGTLLPLLLTEYGGFDAFLEAAASGSPEMLDAAVAAHPVGFACLMLFGIFEMLLTAGGAILFFFYRKKLHFYPAEKDLPRDTEGTVAFASLGVILFIAFCIAEPILFALL